MPITLAEAAQRYLELLQQNGKSKATLYTYGKDLEQIQAFFGPERTVQSISLQWIGRFLKSDELLRQPNGKDRASQTVNKTIRVFRMLLTWLHQEGTIEKLCLPKSISVGKSTL
jgi:site-specific recombinase XerD